MKFQKESFLAFLQSLKQGSVLIVAAIKKSTEEQNAAKTEILTAAAKAQEKLNEIAGKEIDLHALESISQNIEESKNTLEKIKTAVEEKPSGEITISTPVKIEKPSWLSELKTPLSPIVEGFASLIGSLSTIKSAIEQIGKRETKLPLSKDGRIMVEVDRIGGGSGSKFSKEGLATEEKQNAIIGNYATITTGEARKKFVLDDGTDLVSGDVPYVTTNGRLASQTPVADGTYTVGKGLVADGTITITHGIITAVQQASDV